MVMTSTCSTCQQIQQMQGSREEVYGHVASLLCLEEKGTVQPLGWELGAPVSLVSATL